MDISDKDALRAALSHLASRFRLSIPDGVSRAYFDGQLSDPGVYERVGQGSLDGHPFWAYFLAAEGYLRQPSPDHYYDIFRAARAIPILRRLDEVTRLFEDSELERHVAKVVRASTFDELDTVLFEIVVGGAYRERFPNGDVTFVQEQPPGRSADLLVTVPERPPLFVECKSVNRTNDFHADLRRSTRALLRPILAFLRDERLQRVVQVRFDCMPTDLESGEILATARKAVVLGSASAPGVRVDADMLGLPDTDFLFPSPKYFRQRYGYDSASWNGVLPALEGTRLGVSWFEHTTWESAVLWRVENPEAVWRAKKLNFRLFFDALAQRRSPTDRLNVHIWLERNSGFGNRAEHLQKFLTSLGPETKPFSYIVFNETHPEVTPGGHFDFREHASLIGGPQRDINPELSGVFVRKGPKATHATGEWGVGAVLPSLDD